MLRRTLISPSKLNSVLSLSLLFIINDCNKEEFKQWSFVIFVIRKSFFLLEGSEFFAGSDSREVRKRIIDKWDSEVRDSVFEQRCNSNGKSDSHKSRKLSELNWHIGGGWSRQFMDISGFDSLFYGRKIKSMSVSDYEDVEPYKKLPDLVDYQIGIKEELQKALSEQGDDAKCLISLPTGTG